MVLQKLYHESNSPLFTVGNSYDRVEMGKVFWKAIALQVSLYALGAMTLNEEVIIDLQKLENRVLYFIFRTDCKTPLEVMRGEMGAMCMKSRVIESKLLLVKDILEGKNKLIITIVKFLVCNSHSDWGGEDEVLP